MLPESYSILTSHVWNKTLFGTKMNLIKAQTTDGTVESDSRRQYSESNSAK